ncbi:hypothetical protein GGX14DRAFT_318040, partial [Mycena pura]
PERLLQGKNLEIVWRGEQVSIDGTSCASPSFACVIALLTYQLIAADKRPLAFLN